jgi:hypothetical protein
MKFFRIAAACAACALNAAFAAPAAPAAPAPAALMMQAFPGWSLLPASHVQTVTLPHMAGLSHEPGLGVWSVGPNRVLAEPRLTLRLDATHLTLIVGMVPAAENGKPAVSHALPMAIAAYQFERRGGSWQLATRQGVFAMRGFSGGASLRAVELSDRRQALEVEYGSCWQGYCGTWMALYELDKGAMRQEPAVEMALSGINVDSTGDCMRRLQPLIKPHPQDSHPEDDKVPGESHDCYAIESSWTVEPSREQPGDLLIHYLGAMSRAQAYTAPPSAIDQRQVLRYYGGKYRAISGFNPVPPI